MSVPYQLQNKEIRTFIDQIIFDYDEPLTFDALDEIQKDHFVSLSMKALKFDLEIIMTSEANFKLVDFLSDYNSNKLLDLASILKKSAYEEVKQYFNELVEEALEERKDEVYSSFGLVKSMDNTTGEIIWR